MAIHKPGWSLDGISLQLEIDEGGGERDLAFGCWCVETGWGGQSNKGLDVSVESEEEEEKVTVKPQGKANYM